MADIEKELMRYKDQFRGKVVYCNCDDPYESNFFKYFATNYNALNLKKLIATSFLSPPIICTQLALPGMEVLEKQLPKITRCFASKTIEQSRKNKITSGLT